LRATRKGNAVTLTWTAPTRTTDGHNIRQAGLTGICRASESLRQCDAPIAKLAAKRNTGDGKSSSANETYIDNISALSADTTADSTIVYAVSVFNFYGRSAGLSNQVEVPAAPVLAVPRHFRALLTGQGVALTWDSVPVDSGSAAMQFLYRIYRRQLPAQASVIAGEVSLSDEPSPSFLDRSIEWEKTYQYWATVVTAIASGGGSGQQVEGEDTPAVTILAHDVFPPATPIGLQAVFSGPGQRRFIDLVWTPDSDADLAGYNVYRWETGGEAIKLNSDLVKSPAFRDASVVPGHEYSYSVSAADVRGNESARSPAATERVPQEQ
jgi:hypothetical protein